MKGYIKVIIAMLLAMALGLALFMLLKHAHNGATEMANMTRNLTHI